MADKLPLCDQCYKPSRNQHDVGYGSMICTDCLKKNLREENIVRDGRGNFSLKRDPRG